MSRPAGSSWRVWAKARERQEITFTRSRAYKKNDSAHVEQKNGAIVRYSFGNSHL